MAIQYSTGVSPINTLATINDKASLMTAIDSALTGAGWTITTTTSSTNKIYQSVLTPQSNQIKIHVWDAGGSCIKFQMMNVAQTLTQSDGCYLAPATSTAYRLIVDQYQFCIFVPGSISSRNFVMGSALYLPPNLTQMGLTTSAFIMGDGGSDTDTTNSRGTFRTSLTGRGTGTPCNYWSILNSSTVEVTNASYDTSAHQGLISMAVLQSANMSAITGYRWHDNSSFLVEPLVAWGYPTIDDEAKVRGQLWDSFVATDSYPPDTTTTVDSHNFYNITNNNNGSVAVPGSMRGSVFLVTP